MVANRLADDASAGSADYSRLEELVWMMITNTTPPSHIQRTVESGI